MKTFYQIRNRYGTVIWEGRVWSAYEAWQALFEQRRTPREERVIARYMDFGMEVIRFGTEKLI